MKSDRHKTARPPRVRLTSAESLERLDKIRKLKRRSLSYGALIDELAREWFKQFRGDSGPELPGVGAPTTR